MTDRVGQRLGNYRLIRLLGRGGFAEVYLGQHMRLNMQAAIKVLHTQLVDDDVENFHREAETIASLIHPHIVRLLDFNVEDCIPFLVMDYAPNGSLRQLYPKGIPLPLATILLYTKQIADALQYAHNERLIHRDIKPENMLLGRNHEVLLTDFGIATMTQSSRYQVTQEAVGTIYYMAPEQIQGKPRHASDQYALGVVLYEWLSGERPFNGSFTEIVAQHLAISPPPLYGKVPVLSSDIEHVVMKALAKDPQKRFPSVQDFATALEGACQTLSSNPAVPATNVPLSDQPSPLAHTVVVYPPSQLSQLPNAVTPPNQLLQSTNVAMPPYSPDISSSALGSSVQPGKSQSLKRNISRRKVLIGGVSGGLALLAIAFSTRTTWLNNTISHGTSRSSHSVDTKNNSQQTSRTDAWSLTSSMAIKRSSHSATLLQDGSVLVAGGIYAPNSLVGFAEIYTPLNGTWSRTKGDLHVPRVTTHNSLVTLADGKALFAAGANALLDVDYASAELYDPTTGMWSETSSLNIPRRGAAVVLLKGGQRVLVASGAHGPPDGNRFLASAEIYDISSKRWVYTGTVNVARDGAQAVLLNDGRVLIAGGEGPWNVHGTTAEIFDPETNTWSVTGTMPWGWSGASMTTLPPPDGRVFVCGGGNGDTVFSQAAFFHPATGEWQQVAPMRTARSDHIANLIPENRMLISGGGNASGIIQSSEIYNVATNTWLPGPSLQEPRVTSRAVSLATGDILTIGGWNGTPNTEAGLLASCEIFIV